VPAFDPDVVAAFDSQREIDIETIGRRTGRARRTTIWVVVHDGVPYVRSEYGDAGQWYRNALAQPSVTLHIAGRSIPAVVKRVDDAEQQRQVSDALKTKYRSSSAWRVMVDPAVEPMTLALAPAD
jgi:deazaflavin-dependent oxidoreductase (nitroreductase family)